jgi:glycolate oxidase iron-sulfur subunit
MDPWFEGVHRAVADVLVSAGYRVTVPAAQTCCGALAAHEGAAYDAVRMAERNVRAFEGFDHVVVDAAGCGAHLASYGHRVAGGDHLAARTVDATVIVARLIDEGRLPELSPREVRVAVQDPCHLRHAQRIVDAPRRVLAAAGYQPVDIDADGLCCGAAGAYAVTQPETSDALGRRKAAEIGAAAVSAVASANPGCEMQLRQHLPPGSTVKHPVELYAEALATARGEGASFAEAFRPE